MDESAASAKTILLIDDEPNRAQIIATALKSAQHRVLTIASGSQTLDFLLRRGEYTDAPRPDLILLELNLPDRDGREILAIIKASTDLRRIPIVVLTTAANEADVLASYELQGNCHVVKSTDLDRLLTIVKRIEAFWLGIVTLPIA